MALTIAGRQINIARGPLSGNELRNKYDQYAAGWQRIMQKQGYVQAYAQLIECWQQADGPLAKLPTHTHLLDNGIGTAALSLAFAQQLDQELTISGIDFSARMLRQARTTLKAIGQQVRTYQRDARWPDFADNYFDLVASAHLLEHLEDPAGAIREMGRVLKPGAPLILIISRPTIYTRLIQSKWRFKTFREQEMLALLHDNGLQNAQSFSLTGARPRLSSRAYLAFKPISRKML